MSIFQRIDLSLLPPPDVVETLSYEQILADAKADLIAKDASYGPVLAIESEPMTKMLEVFAYRELLLRQRINNAAMRVMLAFASGNDLDHIGANFSVPRLLVDEGNPTAIPPIAPVYESDKDYKRRIQLSFEAFTTAGSEASYLFHSLSASGQVADAAALSPSPGNVDIYVLARTGSHARKFDFDELKALYNGRSPRAIGLKTSGTETYEPPFRGSIVISQNATVNANDAVLQRIIHLHFMAVGPKTAASPSSWSEPTSTI